MSLRREKPKDEDLQVRILRPAANWLWATKRMPKISDPPRKSWIYKIPSTSRISEGSLRDESGRRQMDLSLITVASNWTVNARTAIARRYVCSTSVAERPDCLRSVAKDLASPGSSRLFRQLRLGEERVRNIILEKKIHVIEQTANKISFREKVQIELSSPFLIA